MQTSVQKKQRIQNYNDFWPFYVSQHLNKTCRTLHFIGTFAALFCLLKLIIDGALWALPLGLFFGYAFAWIGHFVYEKNRPATFQYPLWSFVSDFRMWYLMLTRRMDDELSKLGFNSN